MTVTNFKISIGSEKFALKIRSGSGKLSIVGCHFPPKSTIFGTLLMSSAAPSKALWMMQRSIGVYCRTQVLSSCNGTWMLWSCGQTCGSFHSVTKCKVLHLGSGNSCQPYTMRGAVLEVTPTERNLSPVHGSCCRADCCCLLLMKRADQSASSSGGKGMWGGRRCMTSYFCCLLLSLLTRKSVSPTAGGETGARGDSD